MDFLESFIVWGQASFIWTVYLFDIKAHLFGRYKINYQVIVEAILL